MALRACTLLAAWACLAGLAAPGVADAQSQPRSRADAVRVIDGDGLNLDGRSVRLWGIDAPERDQSCLRGGQTFACGDTARDALRSLIANTRPVCAEVYKDRYGRTVARCAVLGHDLGGAMVAAGWALDFERYSHGAYRPAQQAAQAAKRGLWAGSFVMPSEWRKHNGHRASPRRQ